MPNAKYKDVVFMIYMIVYQKDDFKLLKQIYLVNVKIVSDP